MKQLGMIVVIAAVVLGIAIGATASGVWAQTAEELVKQAGLGTHYVGRWVDEGQRRVISVYIRGDQIIYNNEVGPSTGLAVAVDIVDKYREGDKVILKTGQNNGYERYTISGARLIRQSDSFNFIRE